MQAPEQITPQGPADYLEVMTKAVFQSGMSWQVVKAKWPGFQEAFEGFDPERVAAYGPDDVDRLAADTRIIRNRRKLEATVDNAQAITELAREHGGFDRWLRSLGSFEEKVAGLRRNFSFLGEFGAYYFLYVVGEEVPPHEEWSAAHGRDVKAAPARRARR
jgi:3-methyladenine DNA glycosylase Tag